MKKLYLFLHPWCGVKNSIFSSDNGIGQGGTICHSTWKLDNVMFSIHAASVVAKKSRVNLYKSHFLGLRAKTGLRTWRPETSRKRTGLELPPFPAVSLEEKLILEMRLPPIPVVCWMEKCGTGKLAEQHRDETSWLYAVRHWTSVTLDAVWASSLQRSCSRPRLIWTWQVQEHRLPVQLLCGCDSGRSLCWCWQQTC